MSEIKLSLNLAQLEHAPYITSPSTGEDEAETQLPQQPCLECDLIRGSPNATPYFAKPSGLEEDNPNEMDRGIFENVWQAVAYKLKSLPSTAADDLDGQCLKP